jgi:hypothetical protein
MLPHRLGQLPTEQMLPFAFIAQDLHAQIEPHFEGLVSQICGNYGHDIDMIIANQ